MVQCWVADKDRLATPDACRTELWSLRQKFCEQQHGAPTMTATDIAPRDGGVGMGGDYHCLAVLGPLVLAADLVLLLGSEVVLDVEGFADLLRRLSLDHVCDGLAADVKEGLDVHVVGSEDDLEEHLLVDLHELLVPLLNVGGLLAGVGIVVLGGSGVVLVLGAPLEHLLENVLGDLEEECQSRKVAVGEVM